MGSDLSFGGFERRSVARLPGFAGATEAAGQDTTPGLDV
jgi:hypothetical protein